MRALVCSPLAISSGATSTAYRESELGAGIPAAYKVIDKPSVEILDGFFQLRNRS